MRGPTRRGAVLGLLVAGLEARAAQAAVERLRIRDLYAKGAEFSDKAQSLSGQKVVIQGFMAPPLKADAAFFVLTKLPMAVCPFCDSELNWPTDIVLVRLHSPPVDGAANDELIEVLARALQVPKRAVSIVTGDRSRQKRVRVVGIDADTAASRLRSGRDTQP